MQRDDAAALDGYLRGPGALWLAYAGDRAIGCVAVRPLDVIEPDACEVKRLYVQHAHRGARVANALMDALEAFARETGRSAVYLDSRSDFDAAIRLYERRGYAHVPRFNDNPEAAVFMRLDLRAAAVNPDASGVVRIASRAKFC